MRQIARLRQTSTHAKGFLELLESDVSDGTLIEVDSFQVARGVALLLYHRCDRFGAPVPNLIALQAESD